MAFRSEFIAHYRMVEPGRDPFDASLVLVNGADSSQGILVRNDQLSASFC